MIPLCEPASAQKTGLEHNVWYMVVQGDLGLYASQLGLSFSANVGVGQGGFCWKPHLPGM